MGRFVYMFYQKRELLLTPEQSRFGKACSIRGNTGIRSHGAREVVDGES